MDSKTCHTIWNPYKIKYKFLEETMGVHQEMKEILYLEEVLVDTNHLTVKDQKPLEEGEQIDHLMEILGMMDPQVVEDILPDEDHQEVDLQDHQEEDRLVPLEILDPQEIKDHQAPLDHEDTEDLLDYKDLWDLKVHPDL